MHISHNVHAFKTSACGIKPPLLLLWFGIFFFYIKILSRICGKEIGTSTTFAPAMTKEIKEKRLVIFRYYFYVHLMILMNVDSEGYLDKTRDCVEDW